MLNYILRRLFLIIPTLIGIMLVNFTIIQFAPGGPVEQAIAQFQGNDFGGASSRISGTGSQPSTELDTSSLAGAGSASAGSKYRGAEGLRPDIVAKIEKQFGFDRPAHERFLMMMWDYARFDFGDSYFKSGSVYDIVMSKMPVSISLGLWTTLIVYLVSIPLGIAKAVRDGQTFDVWTSALVSIGYAVPSFLLAILLIILFSGGSYFDWFPLRGLVSDDFDQLSTIGKIKDYFWHLALPVTAMVLGGFASLTMLTKNSFLDQLSLQYVETARAKGLTEKRVLWGHVFRNAMLIVIAGFPSAFIGILFTGSLLIEIVFSLDGLGLLGYEAAIKRDYPIVFATLYFFTLLGLVMQLVGDLTYRLVDPRIDFEATGQ